MSYLPGTPPDVSDADLQRVIDYVRSEFSSIQESLGQTNTLELRQSSAAPDKPREGMIVAADGTNWDPGEGAGVYKYEGAAWVKLGNNSHTHVLADITDAGLLAGVDSLAVTDLDDTTADRVIGTDNLGAVSPRTITQILDLLAGSSRGGIPVRGATDWTALAVGAAGKVLGSDGTDPLWTDASWLKKIEDGTVSGSSIVFDNIPNTYQTLLMTFGQVSTTGGSAGYFEFSSDNLSSLINCGVSGIGLTSSGTVTGAAVDGTAVNMFGTAPTAAQSMSGVIIIFEANSNSKYKIALVLHFGDSGSDTWASIFGVLIKTTSVLNAFRFSIASGTFDAGYATLYGII